MKKKLALFLIPLAISAVALTACGSQEEQPSEPESSSVPEVVVSEPEPQHEGIINNLTGLYNLSEEAEGKRPIAVMINNISLSLPQYGIYDADVMYETLVEGGITRMMAVYGDYTKVPDVCSVRSCRYYYPILADGMDAIYYHSGLDMTIAPQVLAELGIEHFDINGEDGISSRDQDRLNQGYGIEHTMVLHGSELPNSLKNAEVRMDLLKEKSEPIFNFNDPEKPEVPKDAQECTTAELTYSGNAAENYWSTFTYDAENHVYLKQHNGDPHMDVVAGKQLAYTNVFALETSISVRDDKGHMDVDLTEGKGYYITEGTCQNITWSKADRSAPLKVFDENGKELTVNAGKSYIGFVPHGMVTIQ